ncbi:sporulation protein YtxC [Aquibacillus saliphilus]|uniref:sporulation protein YtxC n=1 Tax=Aquibacillus saliphilus TaxID=1909422 RepID=UPI001CEFC801
MYFESHKEAVTFCQRLFKYDKHCKINWKESDLIKIEVINLVDNHQKKLGKAMTDVFIFHREMNWIKYTIKHCFYYQNKEEILRIIELTQSIIVGGNSNFSEIAKNNKPRTVLLNLFETYSNELIIHFDSIINFRFQSYRNDLIDVVGLAIDEFKREEEYQTFVESLRKFIMIKEPKYSTVHVTQGHDFTFYRSDGSPFSTLELKTIINGAPLYIVGLDEEELNLTPLLAMIPEEIIIYGNHPSEAKTLTIINIFQEKVKFKPLKSFPYPIYSKSE